MVAVVDKFQHDQVSRTHSHAWDAGKPRKILVLITKRCKDEDAYNENMKTDIIGADFHVAPCLQCPLLARIRPSELLCN